MIYGYARVSTDAQDLTSQLAQLKAAGCEKVFREKITGTTADRPQLQKLMKALAPGDVVITPAVDRLSRDATDLLVIARDMQRAGAGLRSIAEPVVDTTSDLAELVLAMLGVAAKLECRRILERTARGRADAKAKGVKFGRKPTLTPAPATGGPRTRRRRRDTAQRRPELQRQSGDDFEAASLIGYQYIRAEDLQEYRRFCIHHSRAFGRELPAEPNCVRSSTRIPVRQPGDAGVTSIVDSLSGKKPADAGSGASSSVVALDSAFANEPSRTYPNRSLPVLSEFDYMGDWSRLWRQAAVARSTPPSWAFSSKCRSSAVCTGLVSERAGL
jgi:DNA invertase Pin-like site-specific DNA recombinase